MDTSLLVLFVIGLVGGFAAGLLGLGGGIVIVPLLAYVGGLSFHTATSISIVQVFASAVSGVQRHYRLGTVNLRVAAVLGGASALTAAAAAAWSPLLPSLWLQVAFFMLLVGSAAILALPRAGPAGQGEGHPRLLPALALGVTAGLTTGLLGAGGGFIMVPLLIRGLGLRTKTAIGTSLAAILVGSLVGVLAKVATAQIDYGLTAVVVLGGTLGAQAGAITSHRLASVTLRRLLFALLLIIALRTLAGILFGAA